MNTVSIQQKTQLCPPGTLLHNEIMLLGSETHLRLFGGEGRLRKQVNIIRPGGKICVGVG